MRRWSTLSALITPSKDRPTFLVAEWPLTCLPAHFVEPQEFAYSWLWAFHSSFLPSQPCPGTRRLGIVSSPSLRYSSPVTQVFIPC